MRSREARRIALEFLTSKEPKLRHFAGVLLGWVGPESDLTKLGSLLLTDEDPRVRGAGAGAQCQMWYRIPKIKSRLLWYSKQAIERETDEEVQQDIVIMVQTVLKKRLGIKENIDEGTITGDIPKAVIKTKKLLETLDKEGLLQKP
jgi:hypothetical protein